LAEKAAGALLDFGARTEDVSVVRYHEFQPPETTYAPPGTTGTLTGSELTTPHDPLSDAHAIAVKGHTHHPGSTITDPESGLTTTYTSEDSNQAVTSDERMQPDAEAKLGISTTTPADAAAGAVKGTAIGIGVGVGAALVSLLIPGVGLVLGGGALAAALGGVAASAAAGGVAGGVAGYLKDQGLDDHVATSYNDTVRGGGALLAITIPSNKVDEVEARRILDKYGATNVHLQAARRILS
jgi:hypothetical protein